MTRRRVSWAVASALALAAFVWAWEKPLRDRPDWLDDFDRHGAT